jgi:hypothetical protein
MASVAQALRRHGPTFLQRLKESGKGIAIPIQKALAAITRCRSGALGGVHWKCRRCARGHWVGRSCGNRHCPTCGHERTQQWLEKQSVRLLRGVHHFLVTFTVPQELRIVLRTHPRAGYEVLFKASADALRDVASQTRALVGSQLGFFGVLHTWGRDPMVYHPHVHFVVPGGGVVIDSQGKPIAWKSTPTNFLVHHATLIRVYKAKLADELRAAGLYDLVPADAWNKDFVVDIQPVDDGHSTVAYLAPYVHRVAVSDQRILDVSDNSVTYRFKPKKSRAMLTRTVSGEEFVRGFAQHVLPTGFRKVRYFGWMANRSKTRLEELPMIVWFSLGWVYWLATAHASQPPMPRFPQLRCAACGGEMEIVTITDRAIPPTLSEHPLAYLDSS